jgi:hypothetical protein
MRGFHNRITILFIAVIACAAAGPRFATASIINVSFISTTNNAYNDRAYFQNTGINVHLGDILVIQGSGVINVGGGYSVKSNFDMGLISPLNSPSLVRDYHGVGNNYTGAPLPLAGETVLFSQQRSSLNDDHDLSITIPVLSNGYMYLGMFDSYFADNTGSHSFAVQITPEPSTLAILAVFVVPFCRHKRRTNS